MFEIDKKGNLLQNGEQVYCIWDMERFCNRGCMALEVQLNSHYLLSIVAHCCKREIKQK